jgi:hypothetical protein
MASAIRPKLTSVPVASVWPRFPGAGLVYATMSRGQWDGVLHGIYDAGGIKPFDPVALVNERWRGRDC